MAVLVVEGLESSFNMFDTALEDFSRFIAGVRLSFKVLNPDVPGTANEAPGDASNMLSKFFKSNAGFVLFS